MAQTSEIAGLDVEAIRASQARRASPGAILGEVAPPLLALLVALALWEIGVQVTGTKPYILPGPIAILAEVVTEAPYYLQEGWVTLVEALVGFALGSGVAFVVAIFMAHSRFLEKSLLPLAVAVKATPIIAIAPLFVIWFGFGYTPKILVVALIVFFPVLVNAITGFRAISPAQKEFMQSIHASSTEVFLKLRLYYALPYLFSAFKVSITLSVIGAVIGEWSGAESGLGRLVLLSSINFQTIKLFAAIVYLALMGILLTIAIGLLERRLLFWHESVLVE
jgi:NitT/TauT family transport system permease protein